MEKSSRNPKILAICTILTIGFGCGTDTTHFAVSEIAHSQSPSAMKEAGSATSRGFNLINSPSFLISINGCKSGYTSQVTAQAPRILLYKDDWNCLGKLIEFEKDGKLFRSVPSKGFTTYQYGDKAIFASDDGMSHLTVRVTRQLSNPTVEGDTVSFSFTEVEESMQKLDILRTVFGSKGSVLGNRAAPPIRLSVRKAEIIGLDTSREAARVLYKVECNVPLRKAAGKSIFDADSLCGDIRLKDIEYVLIKDSSNGVPCADKAKSCDKFFSGNKSTKVETADIVIPGTEGLINGGFYTKRTISAALMSPSQVAENPEMLLIFGDGTSYAWFNLDFDVQESYGLTQIALAGMEEE